MKPAQPTPTPIGEMWLDDGGVLHHRLSTGAIVTAERAELTLAAMAAHLKGKRVPVVVDIRGVASADNAARDVFAQSDAAPFEIATAILATSKLSSILGNAYLRFNRPERPTRMFTDEARAVEWAHSFLGD